MGMTGTKEHSRAAFHSSLAYFWTPFGEGEDPNGAVWEHITCFFCVMHISLNSAPLPDRMTSSSTDHHKLTMGLSPFIAYNFTALSCKHSSVPLLQNTVKIDLSYTHHNQSNSRYIIFLLEITIPWFCIFLIKCLTKSLTLLFFLGSFLSYVLSWDEKQYWRKHSTYIIYIYTHIHAVCTAQFSSFYLYLMSFYEYLVSINAWCSLLLYTSLILRNS